jgi:hypothetical protein
MTRRERWAAVAHDLALGWMTGGIGGAGVCAVLLFQHAPSREVAGQIGNVIFTILGQAVFALTLVLLAARLFLRRAREGATAPRLWPAVLACALAGVLALWLTPAMTDIWGAVPHDPAGSGLMGDDKARFMRLHGAGNLIYLTLFAMGCLLIAARAMGPREPGKSLPAAGAPGADRSGRPGAPGEPSRT